MENASDPRTGRLRSANGDSAEVTQTETHREKRTGRRGGARLRAVGQCLTAPQRRGWNLRRKRERAGDRKYLKKSGRKFSKTN